MTDRIVTINASTPGYDFLMATLRSTRTVQAATFGARVRATIQQRNDAGKPAAPSTDALDRG